MEFDSLNPYQSLEVIVGDNPQDLIDQLKRIRTPIKIVGIVPYGTRQAAYIIGDVRPSDLKRVKIKGVK